MSYILGINIFHADSSACLLRDGKIVAAVEEERFNRIKHFAGAPIESIKYCLDYENISLDQIDYISINQNSRSNLLSKLLYLLYANPSLNFLKKKLKTKLKRSSFMNNINLPEKYGIFKGKISNIDHHLSHIASSYYISDFENSVNLSIDGFGDFCSTAWGIGKGNKIKIDNKILFPHSMGIFYQALTQYLGFKKYGDEYKLMGLAPYGNPIYVEQLKKIIDIKNDGTFKLNLKFFLHHKNEVNFKWKNTSPLFSNLYSDELIELLGPERKENEKINQYHMDLASSVQKTFEDFLISLLNLLYKKYNIDNLTLSGGCAMNSAANGKILIETPFKKLFISSNPGDGGGSIGASLVQYYKNKKYNIRVNQNKSAYLGNSYDNESIEKKIEENNLKVKFNVEKLDENQLIDRVSNSIKESLVVGWFQGRMEWGPRALGNRSILGDARNPNMKDILNLKIKRRESFRPFAPSILIEDVGDWFEVNEDVPYMSEVYKIKNDKRSLLPAVNHVNNTGRLQTVSSKDNLLYYKLISEFKKKTGVPIILNTSFNENEPIVRTPDEALSCYQRTKMDILVMQNWFISRK